MSSDIDLLGRAPVWRDYLTLLAREDLSFDHPPPLRGPGERASAMRRAIDLLWSAFACQNISWIGFYEKTPGEDAMTLACREPKPACSPIGLHGMCGRGWQEKRPIIIADVATLGANYIACDPLDRSELVIPCIDDDGECWGVLDADSYETGAFDEHDAQGMTKLLIALGLTHKAMLIERPMRL